MTAKELAELKAELLAELRAEQERKDRNRSTFKKVMEPFEGKLNQFDWTDKVSGTRPDGSTYEWKGNIKYDYALRSSFGTLLRAIYRVKTVSALPIGKKEEMECFLSQLLKLMEDYRHSTEIRHEQAG